MRVGIDSVEIKRIAKSLSIKGFRERIFSEEEIQLLDGKAVQSYAANFAAKEAFSKAVGTGIRGFLWTDVSILRDELGAPYLKLTGCALNAAKGLSFTVSLTHTKDIATAIVIAYRGEECLESV